MDTILQLLLKGISQGCVYGLIALGFVLIYKATEMINFAQGELMMIGALIAVTFTEYLQWNYFVAVVLTVLATGFIGLILERSLLRRMIGEPPFAVLMVTIGLGFVLRALAGMIWGHDPQELRTPYSDAVISMGDVFVGVSNLVVIGGTIALCIALFLFFRYTRIGIAMQASSQNQLAAYYLGIPVKRIVAFTWALSAGIAAIAGILFAPLTAITPNIGFSGIKAFAAAIVGGFGSLPGAIIGGLSIGIVEQFMQYNFGKGLGDTSAYFMLLLMLLVRPSGLIASTQKKKV